MKGKEKDKKEIIKKVQTTSSIFLNMLLQTSIKICCLFVSYSPPPASTLRFLDFLA